MKADEKNTSRWAQVEKEPVALFAMLEIARERHDFRQAALAQMKLRALGIDVHYTRKRRQEVASG